jgi:hypothetical protein
LTVPHGKLEAHIPVWSKETPVIKVCTTLESGAEVCTTIDLAHDAASRAYTTRLGNGTDTSFTLTHNLDSLDILPIVRDVANGDLTGSQPTVTAADANTAHVDFDAAPTQGQFQVTLLAVTPSV